MMVDLILDVFKYQIIRSVGKTSIRRKIERKLKKKKVFEIPNLIDLLDIRNLLKAKFFVTTDLGITKCDICNINCDINMFHAS